MSEDQFGGPAPRGKRMTSDGIELDNWDRYKLPDPLTGEWRAWTRASTVANTLPDNYYLNLWKQRNVASGIARRPDLAALAASMEDPHGHDKATMNDICKRAQESAGGTARRDLGTALHAFTANHDKGTPGYVPPQHHGDIAAYAELLRAEGLLALPEYAERVVCVPEWGIAGRLDRVLRCFDGRYRVGDVKTGARADEFGDLEFVVQQGIYVRGLLYGVYDPLTRTWQPFPHAAQVAVDVALIIHLPVGEPERAAVYAFNVAEAAYYVQQALDVRGSRKAKNLRTTWQQYAAFLREQPQAHYPELPAAQPAATGTYGPDGPIGAERPADELTHEQATAALVCTDPWCASGPAPCGRTPNGHLEAGLDFQAWAAANPNPHATAEPTPPGDPLEAAAFAVTGALPAGRVPSTYELVRAAMTVPELAALWSVLHPAGHWSVELHEAASARRMELERTA